MNEAMEALPLAAMPESASPGKSGRQQERRAIFDEYERRLLSKMENIAIARGELHEIIDRDPDISAADLKWEFDWRTQGLELSRQEKLAAEWAVETYVDLHRGVKKYRQKYADDAKLYQAIFGCEPKGEIEIKDGPMTFYFICHDIEDYTRIYYGKFGGSAAPARCAPHEIDVANRSGGVAIPGAPVKNLEGSLTAENCSNRKYSSDAIRRHEEQHAWHRLFTVPVSGAGYEHLFRQENDPAKRKRLLYQYCRYMREGQGEHRLANEILAYKVEQARDNEEVFRVMTTPSQDNGLYNYFDQTINNIKKEYAGEPELDQVINDVFVTEYQQMIRSATEAFDQIGSKAELSTRETIALLTMVPVRHWPKIARRRGKFDARAEFNRRTLVRIDPREEEYDCVAQAFDRLGQTRHKQKNKKARYKSKH